MSLSFTEVFSVFHSNPLEIYIIINTLKLSKKVPELVAEVSTFSFLRFQAFLTTLTCFIFKKSQSKFVVAIVFLGDLINLMCCLIFLLLCKSHQRSVWYVVCGVVCVYGGVCVCVSVCSVLAENHIVHHL